ncbi:MAG: hypothetical protein HY329_22615 [Chloroflexi bacterium]|nr:hypothetical protein [Chloroflexota bacterium]
MTEIVAARPPWTASPAGVAAFVAGHGSSYDSTTDSYAVEEPFARPVKAGKNTPIYNAHAYHTKVPYQGIIPYLEHYTKPGDVVLDPFCGSGMTGVACLLTGRHAILNDLSPAATHIAYNYCTPVDVPAFEREWRRLRAAVAAEFDELYGTRCDRCNGPATIQYTVWSDVYGCATCGADLLLWDVAVVRDPSGGRLDPPLSAGAAPGAAWQPPTAVATGRPPGTVLDGFACPKCRSTRRKTQLERRRAEPVLTSYECGQCRPRRAEHPTTAAERELIARIDAEPIPYWYPTTPFDEAREMWRGGHREAGITRVSDFWTKRNLRALAAIHQQVSSRNDSTLRCGLLFAFTGSLNRSSKRYAWNYKRPTNVMTGTLYLPSLSYEFNVLSVYNRKLEAVRALASQYSLQRSCPARALVLCGSSTVLFGVPESSVDYVFTDPPFGSNIFYADCSFLWEAWLGRFTDDRLEAVWNKTRKPEQGGKTLADYERLIAASFAEMFRVLKPGRWASVVFHNSDDRVWNAIRSAATSAGFTLEGATYFDKEQRSFKGVKGEKGDERVSNFDVVLNLHKPGPARARAVSANTPVATAEVTETVVRIVEKHLRSLDGLGYDPRVKKAQGKLRQTTAAEQRTTQFIHSLVIQTLMNEGQDVAGYSYEAVEAALERFCRRVDGWWYLPGEEVRSATLALSDDEIGDELSAIEWLRRRLAEAPRLESDLVGPFQIASVRTTLAKPLRQILVENYVFEPRRGRWRLPTPAEAAEMMDVTRRALRERVGRYLAAPTAASPAEIADWIEECYRRRLYAEAHGLFAHVPRDEPTPERYAALRKLDRVCAAKATSQSDRLL